MTKRVIVELKVPLGFTTMRADMEMDVAKLPWFKIDPEYKPISGSPTEKMVTSLAAANEKIVLIRGEIEEGREEELKALPNVVNVWTDAKIVPFNEGQILKKIPPFSLELATTPCPPTDCDSRNAKGTIVDVAKYLRCDKLWAKGVKGKGIVIGICDTGVSKTAIPAFLGGWSANPVRYPPGTDPGGHGTMCATDALGMCPEAMIYDIGILKSKAPDAQGLLSDAIAGYQWALDQYKKPHILSNSWGLYNKYDALDYATDPDHPFTRKVVEVINAGIIVTFAAGNCGSGCRPSIRCGTYGTGKSIWGANGHPMVITVGAANILEQWIGYSSQGPAPLDPKKPDFCAPSHFEGYTTCDNGTSAANPVCAGVIGLLKSHDTSLIQDNVKEALQKTAKNLCDDGWDPHSGYGMIQAEAAFNYLLDEKKGTVTGKVVEKTTGEAIENARVSIDTISSKTESDGTYELSGVPTGDRVITAIKAGYKDAKTRVTVKKDEEVTASTLELKKIPDVNITGKIVDKSTNMPIEGATVFTDTGQGVMTKSDGTYELSGVPTGDRVVTVTKAGYECACTFVTVREVATANFELICRADECIIADCAEDLGKFDQESGGYPVIDKKELYNGKPTCKALDVCGIQANAGYYRSGGKEFEFDIDKCPVLHLTMKAEKGTDTCLLLRVHDKKPRDFMYRSVVVGKTEGGNDGGVHLAKDYFTIKDDNEWQDYPYDLRKLREDYPDAKTVRIVRFYSGKLCKGVQHVFHFSSLVFKK